MHYVYVKLCLVLHLNTYSYILAKKGREKNTANKAKHSKLIAQKKNKTKTKQAERKARLKAIVKLAKAKTEEASL